MHKFNYFFIGICCLIAGNPCLAQKISADSSIILSTVTIMSTKLTDNATGLNVHSFDSLSLLLASSKTLSDLLVSQTPVCIKTYGLGSLATISLRGTSSNHTGVFWNGLSISPPNNGMTDIGLIPVYFFENIQVQYGGASSVFGGGNIGGSIHINNSNTFRNDKKISMGIGAGSFHDYSGFTKILLSNDKWISSTAVYYHQAKNDFPFHNNSITGNPEERQQNSDNLFYGFLQQISHAIKRGNYLTANIWWQTADRRIPSAMTLQSGNADEKDNSLRSSLTWRKDFTSGSITSKIAWFNDYLHYVDINDFYSIDSKVISNSWILETEAKKQLTERIRINGGVDIRFMTCKADSYNENVKQNQIGCYTSLSYLIPLINWQSSVHIHQGWTEGYDEPFTPSVGIEGPLFKMVSGKINISRNFRAPTFNERYWQPGGNLDLHPEVSWNEEATVLFKPVSQNMTSRYFIYFDVFNSMISNWIIWLPVDESYMIWQPRNIQKVWSRGLEFNGEFEKKIFNATILLKAGYTYTRSTNEESIDGSYQKQLIYVPEHIGLAGLTICIKKITFSYTHHYTGQRFVSSDNSQSLPPYNIGYFSFSRDFSLLKEKFSFQLNVDNVWNSNYQAIQDYPMPGIAFKFSLLYNVF
ncbi:MAG: TonB-dependent receptor plug domain-containing protein [Bacteroidetes bacterium]|nr:TonB-dependent receptor plug domain-containing protein [Bacteroidota bacterium]